MKTVIFFLPFLLAVLAVDSDAQVYKYVDKNGTICFTDRPPSPGYKLVIPEKIITPAEKRRLEQEERVDQQRGEMEARQREYQERAERARELQMEMIRMQNQAAEARGAGQSSGRPL